MVHDSKLQNKDADLPLTIQSYNIIKAPHKDFWIRLDTFNWEKI